MADAPLPGLGHNRGPTMEPGETLRRHAWTRARAQAAEKLSLQVLRMRMARAAELGMSYRSYASVRASSGRDVAALVFTSNALGLFPGAPLPDAVAVRLSGIRRCRRIALVSGALDPVALAGTLPVDALYRAPPVHARWPALREAMSRLEAGPAAGTVLICAAPGEAEWAAAGRLGACLDARRYFDG